MIAHTETDIVATDVVNTDVVDTDVVETTTVNDPIKEEVKVTRTRSSLEKFIHAHKVCDTREDMAEMLCQKVSTVQQRIYNYQKRGINISNKPSRIVNGRRGRRLDVKAINAMLTID